MRHHHKIAARAARSVGSRKGLALSVALGLAAVPVAAFAPMAAAAPSCTVKDITTPASYAGTGALQNAVNGATAGDTLTVAGICMGDTEITTTHANHLTIKGSGTLNGGNTSSNPGTVVTVDPGVAATITGLTITGRTPPSAVAASTTWARSRSRTRRSPAIAPHSAAAASATAARSR